MTCRSPRWRSVLACALAVVLTGAAGARADEPMATTEQSLTMAADGGVVAWPQKQPGGGYRFAVARAGEAPRTVGPRLAEAPPFDVARGRGGTPIVVVWTQGCSLKRRRCDARTLSTSTGHSRRLTRIPYAGGGPPAVAQHGRRIAYTVASFRGSGRSRVRCDVPYTRLLTGTARRNRPHRLDRGHCASIDQLDVDGAYLALLAAPTDSTGGRGSEARIVRVTGGRSRTLQRESQGEESNYLDAVTLDGGAVYTARDGFRQPNVFTRIDPRTGRRTEAQAFTTLVGGYARDHGRQYYTQTATGGVDTECPGATGTACLVVSGTDPFATAARTLVPVLTLRVAPDIVYADGSLTLSGTLTRRRVSRTAVLAEVPVAGTPVTLQTARLGPRGPSPFTPAGAATATDGQGRWSIVLPAPHPPATGYLATAGTPGAIGVASSAAPYPPIWVHMAVTSATRSGDGMVTLRGTIDPPQPGRTARVDRRTKRQCGLSFTAGPTPSTVDTPTGCQDLFTTPDPAATAAVSTDGSRFAVSRPGPAGDSYRAALPYPGTAAVYSGESAQVTVP